MNPTMAEQEPFTGLAIEDLLLDGDGRITIANPRVAERLKLAAKTKHREPATAPNTNCAVCNTVKGCGPLNKQCSPNTVSNCGCPKLE
jgi:hypothetical protein